MKTKERLRRIAIVKKLRVKLDGRSLKWWHDNHIPELCTYGYFIRQINNLDVMQDDLLAVIKGYVKTS